MTQVEQIKPRQPTLSQKYALRFYSFLIPQIIMLTIVLKTHSAALTLSFASFYNVVGHFLPVRPHEQKNISKVQNLNKFILGPLIVSCISTPILIAIIWLNFNQIIQNKGLLDMFSFLFAFGFLISGSIDASHELLHRTQPICKFFTYLNLFFMQFTIYPTQHLYMHHKKVGTLEDPITSPKNKSLYSFYFNAIFSCYKFNFNYSKKVFAFNIASTLLYNILLLIIALKQGSTWHKALFFSLLSYSTLFIMQAVEYIQHYGLVYRSDQKSKPVSEICSWNTSENQLLNWYVFRFQRHSDHHMNAYKIYSTLDLNQKMPQFPFDFVTGIVLSAIPPLWFKIMNPLADQIVQNKPVSKEHRQFVALVVFVLKFVLLLMFPLRLAQYFLFK